MSNRQQRRANKSANRRKAITGAQPAAPLAGSPPGGDPPWPPSPPTAFDSWSHRKKLRHGKAHIEHAETLIRGWATDAYLLFHKTDGDGRTHLLAKLVKPLPDDLPLVVGDALQCLRNSLDNLAFSLALKEQGTLTTAQEKDISFPIYSDAVKIGSKAIKYMSTGAQQDVCVLTPDPGRQPLTNDLLWLLNKTANRDKHRAVLLVAAIMASQNYSAYFEYADEVALGGWERTELDTDAVSLAYWGPRTEGNYQVATTLAVRFDAALEVGDRDVLLTLRRFHDHIRDAVFDRLEKHL